MKWTGIVFLGASQSSLDSINNKPSTPSGQTQRTSPDVPRVNKLNGSSSSNVAAINDVLRRQMAGDPVRNRGPPPQPPTPRNGTTQVRQYKTFPKVYYSVVFL